jgi:subtilase family serine protease
MRQPATRDDSPWVTAAGGSVPNVSMTRGAKLRPDPLWHAGGIFSEGAGFSSVYPRRSYQDGVARRTGSRMRSVPDITMDSQDGTSESAPMVAGVLALATQLNHGRNIRPVNPVLYDVLGPRDEIPDGTGEQPGQRLVRGVAEERGTAVGLRQVRKRHQAVPRSAG